MNDSLISFDSGALRGFLETAPDAMVIVDQTGRIATVNAQTEKLFGYSREELIGNAVEMLIPQRFRARHTTHRSGYSHDPHVRPMGQNLELFGLRKDGTEFPVEISLGPVPTPEGVLIVSAIRDISDRVHIQRELEQKNIELSSASRAKDRFLASMSHELRTPLNAVIGFTGTLLMKLPGPLNEEQERQLQIIQTSARHLLSLINDILDLAKIESGKTTLDIESVDLAAIVDEVIAAVRASAETKALKLTSTVAGGPLVVRSDRRAIRQILTNLVDNAIKYTDRGDITVDLVRSEGAVALRVTDTGIGIAPADMHLLFLPFQQLESLSTRRADGAGLGLHLCQRLATLLRGTVGVESQVGRGSTFTLTLPLQ